MKLTCSPAQKKHRQARTFSEAKTLSAQTAAESVPAVLNSLSRHPHTSPFHDLPFFSSAEKQA